MHILNLKPRCINIATTYNLSNATTQQQPTLHLEQQHHFPSFQSSFGITTHHNNNNNNNNKRGVGKRWKEYQGMSNWEGLLDPLDDNLRAEILRYGHFVEAAYKSFQFDPSSPTYASCRFPKTTLLQRCGLPNTGYKVTKHLRATSGIQLPGWVHRAPGWVATHSSYVGYVAVCDNKQEIERLGRRDVVIAFRGTTTCLEWLENLRATLTNLPCNPKMDFCDHHNNNNNSVMVGGGTSSGGGAMVESGFLSLYTSSITANPSSMSLQQMVRQEIARILQLYRGEPLSLTVTGHSLGAALATLAAYDVNTVFPGLPPVTVISFGGPRVGDGTFRRQLEEQGAKVLRIVNSDDLITKVPGFVMDGGGIHVAGLPSWIQSQWVYAEVGKELRLCSKDSPYLGTTNVATCHELNTYLHLVDGFVSSTCPFRASAKRFLPR